MGLQLGSTLIVTSATVNCKCCGFEMFDYGFNEMWIVKLNHTYILFIILKNTYTT